MIVYIEGLETSRLLLRNKEALIKLDLSVLSTSVLKRNPFQNVFKKKFIILNWSENRLINSVGRARIYGLFSVSLRWLVYRALGYRLIWLRHNRVPHATHEESLELIRKWLSWLEKLVHRQVCLSKHVAQAKGWHYVPHVSYLDELPIDVKARNRRTVVLGKMQPYKNYEMLITRWHSAISLSLIGPTSDTYKSLLQKLVKEQGKEQKINIDSRDLSDAEYDGFLSSSTHVLISYSMKTAYVSGAVHHALSFGCMPIMPALDYRQELIENQVPILLEENFSFGAEYERKDWEPYFNSYGTKAVSIAWLSLFEDMK